MSPAHRFPSDAAQAEWLLADPGNGETINPQESGVLALVSAAAETRALADPVFVGQWLLLFFQTDGGNCVVTAISAVNQTANTIITFADAGESILLIGVPENATATSLRWQAFVTQPESEAPALS